MRSAVAGCVDKKTTAEYVGLFYIANHLNNDWTINHR